MTVSTTLEYFNSLHTLLTATAITDRTGDLSLDEGFDTAIKMFHRVRGDDAKAFFIGNGGSAGIASHLAIDFTKNGSVPALTLSNEAALTCLSNDLGYGQVFSFQLAAFGRRNDLLVAISSSGESRNIIDAVNVARERDIHVMTFSGFSPTNRLRALGDLNFHIASGRYGYVEVAHLALLHAIFDLSIVQRHRERTPHIASLTMAPTVVRLPGYLRRRLRSAAPARKAPGPSLPRTAPEALR